MMKEQSNNNTVLEGNNHGDIRFDILEEGDLLSMVLSNLSYDEWQTSILRVNKTWASAAMSLLERNCVRLPFLNLENEWYGIFQCARHTINFRKGGEFQSRTEYAAFMMAGAHLFDLSIRRGMVGKLYNIYVDRSVVDTLNLKQNVESTSTGMTPPSACSSVEGLRFLQAACIQLSKLEVTDENQPPKSTSEKFEALYYDNNGNSSNNDRAHIQRIGYELHICPQYFPDLKSINRFILPLERENKVCNEFRKALNEIL